MTNYRPRLIHWIIAVALILLTAVPAKADQPEQVTICHAAGLADQPANYVTLTLPWVAVYGQAGHFNENGTTQAGHEEDTLGPCATAPSPSTEPTPSPSPSSPVTEATPSPTISTPTISTPSSPDPTASSGAAAPPTLTGVPDTAMTNASQRLAAILIVLGTLFIGLGLAMLVKLISSHLTRRRQ